MALSSSLITWSHTVDFKASQQLLTQSSEMLHDACKKAMIVGGNTSGGSDTTMEDCCARRISSFNLEANEMNCWTVLNDRLGYRWLKTMTSSSFREDIGLGVVLLLLCHHGLLVVIWQVAAVAVVALVAFSNTQMSLEFHFKGLTNLMSNVGIWKGCAIQKRWSKAETSVNIIRVDM
jgi:hypothetical protein